MRRLKRTLLNAATPASLLLCATLLAAWAYCTWADAGPYHRACGGVRRHDGLRWRVFAVLRVRSSHISIERWEVPLPDDATFPADLITSRHWGAHDMGNADVNLGLVSWTNYRAGIAQLSTPKRMRAANGPTTVPVRGHASLAIRWWFLALLLSTPALARLVTRVRQHFRTPAGHCPHCNYDLRATPDRCPECGTIFTR